jgi:hypothetical protein
MRSFGGLRFRPLRREIIFAASTLTSALKRSLQRSLQKTVRFRPRLFGPEGISSSQYRQAMPNYPHFCGLVPLGFAKHRIGAITLAIGVTASFYGESAVSAGCRLQTFAEPFAAPGAPCSGSRVVSSLIESSDGISETIWST